jgi:hypothetical protein
MSIASWSGRRMLVLWAGGLALHAALLYVPLSWALRHAPVDRSRWALMRERWSVAERADSMWMAAQRANGASGVNAAGDSVYATVSMPSGRPQANRARRGPPTWLRLFVATYLGGIPTALLALTGLWWWRRRA